MGVLVIIQIDYNIIINCKCSSNLLQKNSEDYLESLDLIGVSSRDNDIRFVEDNWESPTLGAWGLGWEVWLNGMEITQFTYFSANRWY